MSEHKLLDNINSPADVKKLNYDELNQLAEEIRDVLVETVSQTGGHLASNLGVVELTIALHKVFDSPHDQIVWDVGHQVYTHKLLTGRKDRFSTLRTEGGLSGFSRPTESKHDIFFSGHSSTSISAAYGLARAKALNYDKGYVIAVIGDGSFTGGLVYEALNNAGRSKDHLIVILNDNKMSISKNVGAMARYLAVIRTKPAYFRTKAHIERALNHIPFIGRYISKAVFMMKSALKNLIYHSTFFEDLGFSYVGPIDGHNIKKLTETLEGIKTINRPVLLHIHTKKGKGYDFAEKNPRRFHGISQFDIETGEPVHTGTSYSSVFGSYLCELAKDDERICAITAAMAAGTGLLEFSETFKQRFFDVGIAEEHAVTFASGLAKNGMVPVFAVYSTFIQRCYDQLVHDAALQGNKIVFAIDRAGFVGEDGETHQGLLDVPLLNGIPYIKVFSPSSFAELKNDLCNAIYNNDDIVAIRYPRGLERKLPDDYEMSYDNYMIYGPEGSKITLVTYGRIFAEACMALSSLKGIGINIRILKLNRVKPIDERAVDSVLDSTDIFFFEEGMRTGGAGENFATMLLERGYKGNYKLTAVNDSFVKQASVASQLKKYMLDNAGMTKIISGSVQHID